MPFRVTCEPASEYLSFKVILMPLSLSCACGVRFEVEETFAGQTVSCPDCQRGVAAPTASRQQPRTSGYALASAVLALVLSFTFVGTIIAVLLGIIGLVSISRHRGQIAGTGYALFGIIWGILFTGLFALAVFKGELFGVGDAVRERMMGGEVERGGPLEVKRPGDGYAITKPSSKWAVAKPSLAEKLAKDRNDLLLIDLSRDAYIDISKEPLAADTFDAYREAVLDRFRDGRPDPTEVGEFRPRLSHLKVRHNRRLPSDEDVERAEILLDVKVGGPNITFLVRMIHPRGSDTVYLIRAWASRRKFVSLEPEIRQALDSFRLLDP